MADEATVQETEEQQAPAQQDEVQNSPESQEQPAEQQTEWTTESLTEAIEKAAEDNDPDRMEELRKLFDKQSAEEPASATEQQDPQQQETPTVKDAVTGEQREMTEAEKKLFKVNYHGEPFEVPDENGLLGYQTTGHLKRAKVHADLRLKDLERRAEEAMNEARAKAQAVSEWEKKYNELKAQASQPVAPQQPVGMPQQPAPAVEKVDRPEPPKYPKLSSSDPAEYTEDDVNKLTKWQEQHSAYLDQNAKYLDYLTQLATQKQSAPDNSIEERVAAHTKELQERLRAAEEKLQAEESTKAELQRKQQEEEYWNRFTRFQSQHKEFSTPVPVQDLYKDVNKWMDELAAAHGHRPPYTPYDANSQDWQTYQRMRSAIADSYLAGNQETLSKAEGIDPPAGYDKFFELGRIYKECKPLVDKGMSLHQAYLVHLDETGQLDQTVNELRAEERARAAKATGDALREHTQHPSAIPNSAAVQGVPGQGLSDTDINWLMSVIDDPRAYASLSPQEQKKADELAARAGVQVQ